VYAARYRKPMTLMWSFSEGWDWFSF